jgi:hypothetical protein
MRNEHHILEPLEVDQVGHVTGMQARIDRGTGEVHPLPEARQRGGEYMMPALA